jgi:hypothetical protein
MASLPNKVEKFKSLESDLSTSIATALWKKAAQVCEYINLSYPVGMMMFFNASQSNVPGLPDPLYWQFADGSTVTNPLSPLFGQTLPDCRGKFFKHPATGAPALIVAGADSMDLSHDHNAVTGTATDRDAVRLDNGEERGQAIGAHTHTIGASTLNASNIPAHMELQVYVRIV